MYGHPFLLENLPPTDSAPLADYLSYLNFLWELLREHADQILPHSITTSVKPGILFSSRIFDPLYWDLGGPALIWSSSQCPPLSKLNRTPPVAALFKYKTLPTNFRLFHYKKG
jgi:hypothetical protein